MTNMLMGLAGGKLVIVLEVRTVLFVYFVRFFFLLFFLFSFFMFIIHFSGVGLGTGAMPRQNGDMLWRQHCVLRCCPPDTNVARVENQVNIWET